MLTMPAMRSSTDPTVSPNIPGHRGVTMRDAVSPPWDSRPRPELSDTWNIPVAKGLGHLPLINANM